ncbi:protein-serine/threonine phosphatase [Ranunculus cassubicifolius]
MVSNSKLHAFAVVYMYLIIIVLLVAVYSLHKLGWINWGKQTCLHVIFHTNLFANNTMGLSYLLPAMMLVSKWSKEEKKLTSRLMIQNVLTATKTLFPNDFVPIIHSGRFLDFCPRKFIEDKHIRINHLSSHFDKQDLTFIIWSVCQANESCEEFEFHPDTKPNCEVPSAAESKNLMKVAS